MLGFRNYRDKKATLTISFTFLKILICPKILGKAATAEIP